MLTNINTINETFPVSKSLTVEKVGAFIEDAENIIAKVISEDFYNELDNYTGSNVIYLTLIKKLQKSIANLTFYIGYELINTHISNQGFQRLETGKGGKQPLYQRQEIALKNKFKTTGYLKLDTALQYMELNKDTFTVWKSSDEYTLSKDNFINSTIEFNKIYIINASRLVFLKLRPAQALTEDFDLIPLIGREFFDELKTQIKTDTLTTENLNAVNYIKKVIAFGTIFRGGISLISNLTETGIFKIENSSNSNYTKQLHANEIIFKLLEEAEKNMNYYLKILSGFLKQNIINYTTYSESSAYDGNVNMYFRTKGTEKVISL